jgi:sugar-specific transcriptional regulator TrmB
VTELGGRSGLEEFGLSEYESRAYLALLKHDSLSVSELAYHAQIPRTKAYAVIKTLVRKGLAELLDKKPVRCRALPPEETLENLILIEEKRVKAMKKELAKLKQRYEEVRKPTDFVDYKYQGVGANALSTKVSEMIALSRASIKCMIGSWGVRVLCACRESLLNAKLNDIRVQIIRLWSYGEDVHDSDLPLGFDVRVVRYPLGFDIFLFDEHSVLIVEQVTGRGVLIPSKEVNSIISTGLFKRLWSISTPINTLSSILSLKDGEDVLELLDPDTVNQAFIRAVASTIQDEDLVGLIGQRFIEELENVMHTPIFSKPIDINLPILINLLTHSLGEESSVRFDPLTKLINIEEPDTHLAMPASVWFFALGGVLKRNEVALQILQNTRHPDDGKHILQAKISAKSLKT